MTTNDHLGPLPTERKYYYTERLGMMTEPRQQCGKPPVQPTIDETQDAEKFTEEHVKMIKP